MEITIPEKIADLAKAGGMNVPAFERIYGPITAEHFDFTDEQIQVLVKLAEASDDVRAKRMLRTIKSLEKLIPGAKISNLKLLPDAINAFVASELPHRWIFVTKDDEINPYLVTYSQYHSPQKQRDYTIPAYVEARARAIKKGTATECSITVHRTDLGNGITVDECLNNAGWITETPALVADYEKSMARYAKSMKLVGKQYLARGVGTLDSESYWYNTKRANFEVEGTPAKVVIDDDEKWGDDSNTIDLSERKRNRHDDDEDEEIDPKSVTPLPVHPYVRVYDLRQYRYVTTHINSISEYIYRRDLGDKLIMPETVRAVIDTLVMGTFGEGDDIIEGKGKSTIILASGKPGTGKTLTAEIYAEKSCKPLYTVQCSQLGTNADSLESSLSDVLKRAARWGAILLIDEADVYIHERGSDLNQNAIVGVFLRLLEYYRGVLFLTTNRGESVDDAVVSRCIAHVRYELPELEDRIKIWKIMADQFKLPILVSTREKLAEMFKVSGRTIKHMCRMAKVMNDAGKTVNVELFKEIVKFQG